jgi:hypothetical protein
VKDFKFEYTGKEHKDLSYPIITHLKLVETPFKVTPIELLNEIE